ncbi:hypothetical protein [Qipengyuania sp. RANM35]|uniref:hypothetical protein n=1 Tax=Qipengyuania sp. RANM35 TaxID=3068635 RepID=UPI0034DB3A37
MARHRAVSAIIYYFAIGAAVPVIALIALAGGWLIGPLLPEDYEFFAALGVLLLAFWGALVMFGKLRRWRANSYFRSQFRSFRGERVPAYSLISAKTGWFDISWNDARTTQLGLSDEEMFFIEVADTSPVHAANGGKIQRHPGREENWRFSREGLHSIEVIERTDEAIKANTSDPTSWGERAVVGAVAHVLGRKVSHRVVPNVAFLVVTSMELAENGERTVREQATFAIPSEIDDQAFELMGVRDGKFDPSALQQAMDFAVGKGVGELTNEGKELLRTIVGNSTMDVVDGILDLKSDFDFVVGLGKSTIGSLEGARGRAMARLIAERLRAWSGLSAVGVTAINA